MEKLKITEWRCDPSKLETALLRSGTNADCEVQIAGLKGGGAKY